MQLVLVYRFGPMFVYYGGVIRTDEVRSRDLETGAYA